MSTTTRRPPFQFAPDPSLAPELFDHTRLPDEDGEIVRNFLEHPQSMLLTDSITPVLKKLHADGNYAIGQDSGIYWKLTEPPLLGCKAPDWYYVPDVPPRPGGVPRRSYVLWKEGRVPVIAIEFVSGDGKEERDTTPETGKFWVYEQGIRIPYYAIFEAAKDVLEFHVLDAIRYRRAQPNERGHYEIPAMGVELGIWHGVYQNLDVPWLRWWDAQGTLLPIGEELVEDERRRADIEKTRADEERARADKLAAKLRSLGVDPESI